MKTPRGTVIFRPASTETRANFNTAVAGLRESVAGFTPIGKRNLMLLPSRLTDGKPRRVISQIVHPLPSTAHDSLSFDLYGVSARKNSSGLTTFEAVLSGPSMAIFNDERSTFRERANDTSRTSVAYVALGRTAVSEWPLEAMADAVQVLEAQELVFDAIECSPNVANWAAERAKHRIRTVPVEGVTVQTFRPGAVPEAMLASLRQSLPDARS